MVVPSPAFQATAQAECTVEASHTEFADALETFGAVFADNNNGTLLLDLAFLALDELCRRDIYRLDDMPGGKEGRVAHIHNGGAVIDHPDGFRNRDLEAGAGAQAKFKRHNRDQHEHGRGQEIGARVGEFENFVHGVRSGWRRIITMA